MIKIDLKRELPEYFKASTEQFSLHNFSEYKYFMVNGSGDPNTEASYETALQLLYGLSYTLKFKSKNELGKDFVVPPLEGLWWADDMKTFETREKSKWSWTMMIMIPEWISPDFQSIAIQDFIKKNPKVDLSNLRIDSLREELSVQVLHIGPYDAEGPTLEKLHKEYMPENNLTFNGLHHEIYLGDPRKSAPEKLKTILRQPVKRV